MTLTDALYVNFDQARLYKLCGAPCLAQDGDIPLNTSVAPPPLPLNTDT